MPQRAVAWAALVALGLWAGGCGSSTPSSETTERANLNFTLTDMNGKEVQLASFQGKPLIVNFWATWCEPCKIEIPELIELYDKYKDRGLTIVGISIDDSAKELRPFASEYKMTYPVLVGLDRDDVTTAFGWAGGIPTSVFVKADGTIHTRLVGIATQSWWEKQIQALF